MTLTINCAACSDGDMLDAKYNWSIFLYNNRTQTFDDLPNIKDYFLESGHDTGQAITVPEGKLEPCKRYRIVGRMNRTYDVVSGTAAAGREFLTNCPPWGGQCDVEPTEGDVMQQKFTFNCTNWQDDGFEDPTNMTHTKNQDSDVKGAAATLYYQFMLRKNNITVPIAEGGESKMPRMELPLIPGQDGDNYELVARIYDALYEYTEVAIGITLNMSSTDGSGNDTTRAMNDTIAYWDDQATYTSNSSTLNKQLRSLTTASSLLAAYPLPDDRSQLEQAAESDGEAVVTEGWKNMWHRLYNPETSPTKDGVTALTERFTKMVQSRDKETENLTGQGIAALGEGMATILYNSEVADDESIFASSDIAERGTVALRKLFNTRPYPVGTKFFEAVFSMTALVDRVIQASIPSYDLSLGNDVLFNASDVGEDESKFMVSRYKVAQAVRDRQKINMTHSVMARLSNALNTMHDSLLSAMVLGQPVQQLQRGALTLAGGKVTGRTLNGTNFPAGSVRLKLDSVDADESESDPNSTVEVKASVFNKNPYAWSSDGSSYEITSPVVEVNMTDKRGSRKLRKLTLTLKRGDDTPIPTMDPYSTADTRAGPDGWFNHRLTLRSKSSAVVTRFKLPSGFTQAVAYFRNGRPPTKERYDVRVEGELIQNRKRRATQTQTTTSAPDTVTTLSSVTVSTDVPKANPVAVESSDSASPQVDGPTYQFFVEPGTLSAGIVFVAFEMPELSSDNNETLSYQFMSFSDMCRVWDEKTRTWDPSACKVSASSTPQETVCICDNPPGMTFASSFFVAPNTIDFSTVFSKFALNNASVYGTIICLAVVWVLGLIWARRKDQKDKERWLVGYLKDNLVDDSYFYLLTVHTGMRKEAGTLSNVKFIIMGEEGDTGVRILSDGKRTLDTGSVMTYILATTQSLGDLQYVRVWHDDSGPGDTGSWYLGRLVAEDLQNGQRYNFLCEKWLALDKDDGQIDRIVPVTLKDEVMTFDKLFSEHARVGITDTHLWLSCFMRPERSTFTRVQRVTCCLALLLLTMITSALFFKPEDSETGESTNNMGMEVKIGIMRFSMATLWTSSASIVITTIPILIFVALFRSYRPKWGPRAQAQQHRRAGLIQMTKTSKLFTKKKQKGGDMDENKNMSDLLDSMLQENPLPHVCVYFAWFLLLGTITACAFFLLLYSMQWGKTTSEEWLASFVISFFESIFVMDPFKVLLLACMFAYCAGNPYFQTHHQHVDIERVQFEAETFGKDEIDPTALPPDPVPASVMEAAKKRRQQEQLAQRVFFELVLYIFFVFCIFSVSYGNRDQQTYMVNKHVEDMFYAADGDAPFPFETITERKDVIRYMNETLLHTAFPWKDLAGNELSWKRRLFASDFTSFRVGPVRVRQVRMPRREQQPKASNMHPALAAMTPSYPPYDLEHEERGSFCIGWRPTACTDEEVTTKLSLDSWKYKDDITPVPLWGIFAFYPTGGYIADFAVNRDVVSETITELHEGEWFDLQTRAVFVELALYNPNVNLFTFIRMGAEFAEVGSVVIWRSCKTLRLYDHLGALGAYVLICEIVTCVVVLIFTVKAIKKIWNQGLAYFKDFWQVLDVAAIVTSYTAVVFYVVKTLNVDDVMELWRKDPKVYVDFYLPVLWDDVYGYLLAGLVFVVSIRLLRVLGYNKRVTMIATVLARSGRPLFGFIVVFFVILTAYMSAGVMTFSSTMYEFRSVWDTYCTLYLVLLGKNVLGRFIEEAPLWAQAYFISLTVLVILILYTMFQAILCNATSQVRSDLDSVPPPYGLTNVIDKFYRAVIADWIPQWLVKPKTAVAPETQAPTAKLMPGYSKASFLQPPPDHHDDNRTQPHRVLATLADHFNKFYKTEEEQKRTRRRRKGGFTYLDNQQGMGSGNTLV
ncbi:polycystin-1-like protein 2 [Littorina saxatilis]|uniref:polycystin-1-like protein 2 n=1 Tax=Littorina saxatilis TaxID=31220 RepID=UPI0038B60E4A